MLLSRLCLWQFTMEQRFPYKESEEKESRFHRLSLARPASLALGCLDLVLAWGFWNLLSRVNGEWAFDIFLIIPRRSIVRLSLTDENEKF